MIVIEGLIIAALVLTGFREAVLNAIPMDLKRAIGIGIGLFIAFIGLVNAGIVVHPEAGTTVTLEPRSLDPSDPHVRGRAGRDRRRSWPGRCGAALLIGIVFTTRPGDRDQRGLGRLGHLDRRRPRCRTDPRQGGVNAALRPASGTSDSGVFDVVLASGPRVALILSVMLSDFFDTMGTVIGIGGEAGLLDARGQAARHQPRAARSTRSRRPPAGPRRPRRTRRTSRARRGHRRGRPDGPDVGRRRGAVPAVRCSSRRSPGSSRRRRRRRSW